MTLKPDTRDGAAVGFDPPNRISVSILFGDIESTTREDAVVIDESPCRCVLRLRFLEPFRHLVVAILHHQVEVIVGLVHHVPVHEQPVGRLHDVGDMRDYSARHGGITRRDQPLQGVRQVPNRGPHQDVPPHGNIFRLRPLERGHRLRPIKGSAPLPVPRRPLQIILQRARVKQLEDLRPVSRIRC